ncbi:lipid II flippase MurJ, partial [uncultured Akkermansia sp.]|uniref:lipid II flippase MurJ n=1 Tax=uncultured Akkermansia sp. TaxID=512294 RepID=UPI0026092CD4
YQWGRFIQEAVRYTGEVLGAYSLGLLGYAGTKVVQPVFLALEKRWVPLIAAAAALAISIGLNYCFVYVLHKNAAWLALTTSVVTTFNFLFYFLYLRRQLGGADGRTLLSGLSRIMAAGILLGAVCWAGKTWFLQGFLNWTFPARVLGISLVCGCAGIVYLAAAFLLKTPELEAVRAKLLKR